MLLRHEAVKGDVCGLLNAFRFFSLVNESVFSLNPSL